MTEQTIINPAIWRTVADELDRIASAEWTDAGPLADIRAAIVDMPECVQRDAIATRGYGMLYDTKNDREQALNRYLLRALAGALRAEADAAEHEARHLALVLSREAIAAGRAVAYCARCQSYRPADQDVCGICGQSQ